jgi:X-Pro dipeptidyl-peptidase
VTLTAADATLSVSEPGHLTNGPFSLPSPLQVDWSPRSWSGPVSNAIVPISFTQHIGAGDALRTGTYATTLTWTLSTTTP